MRLPLILAAAAVALSACTGGVLMRPSEVVMPAGLQARLDEFCRADFVDANTAALGEWAATANLMLAALGQDTIAADGITKGEAATKLLAARGAVCIATAPKPVVVEAVAEAAAAGDLAAE